MPPKIIIQKTVQFCKPLLPEHASIVVAVSGGSDSVALLTILHSIKKLLVIDKLVAAHINHGLRGEESDGDEQLVKEIAYRLELPFFSKKLTGYSLDDPGLELWAREQRYQFLEEIRAFQQCDFIATGHTLDDQAETVIMRLLRGTGLNGLRGIAPLRDGHIIRPLLKIRKKELEQWLHEEKITYRKDRSNDDCRLFRNKIRHTIIPALESGRPGAVEHLAALAGEAQEKMHSIEEQIENWLKIHLAEPLKDSFCLTTADVAADSISPEAVRRLLVRRGISPERKHIDGILHNMGQTHGKFLLPGGWKYFVTASMLYFVRKTPEFSYPVSVPCECVCHERFHTLIISEVAEIPEELNCGTDVVFVDRDGFGESGVYRTLKDEDMFLPFSARKTVSVKKFLAKNGIPLPLRNRTGCLTNADNKIVWIPGIRLDERFRVTSATKNVLKMELRRFL